MEYFYPLLVTLGSLFITLLYLFFTVAPPGRRKTLKFSGGKEAAKQRIGCLFDMEGSKVHDSNGKCMFLCRELGVTYLYKDVSSVYRFKVGDYEDLSKNGEIKVKWLAEKHHGLEFDNLAGRQTQGRLKQVLRDIREMCIDEAGCDILGFRGDVLEKQLLDKFNIPILDLDEIKCPEFSKLYELYGAAKPCNLHESFKEEGIVYCPVHLTQLYKLWLLSD